MLHQKSKIVKNNWRRISQSEIPNLAANFPKTPSPKPARIPPQTPPAGGKSAEAGRIHFPRQLFRPAESILILLEKGSRKVYNYGTKNGKCWKFLIPAAARIRNIGFYSILCSFSRRS